MSDIYDDLLKNKHLVEARGNALADEMIAALDGARAQIVGKQAELQAKFLSGAKWNEESFTRKKAYLEAQRREVERMIGEVYAGMEAPATEAALDTMRFEADRMYSSFTVAAPSVNLQVAFGGAAPLSLASVASWVEVNTIEGMVLHEWLASMSKNTANRIVAAGREAMILGLSVQNTTKLLRQKGIEGGKPALERLARTFLLSASNYADEQFFEANSDIIKRVRYLATLDGRTCPICGVCDGKTYKLDEPRPRLPQHFSCRCVYLPVTGMEKELGLPAVERPAVKHSQRTVHHRDGTTSTKFTVDDVTHTTDNYSQWLARQLKEDPAFVRQVLGKTRFELYKSGKISLNRMVVDGRIRRLSELSK
jgi:SPP1 gp7 family putative phage head morphogenesis protein